MRSSLIASILVAFCLSACNKKSLSDRLPSITTSGIKTFGCILDGNIPYSVAGNPVYNGGGWNISCYTCLTARFDQGALRIQTLDCPANTYEFNIVVGGTVIHPGTYNLAQVTLDSTGNIVSNYLTMRYVNDQGTDFWYQTDSLHTGQLVILRASDSIYSGTFTAQLILPGTNKLFSITSGRFDVKLN